jgi:hypothetical protein
MPDEKPDEKKPNVQEPPKDDDECDPPPNSDICEPGTPRYWPKPTANSPTIFRI